MKIGPLSPTWLDVLLVFVPAAVVLEVARASDVWIFVASCLAIVPLAGWMGRATEHLAAHYGPGIGGLLNATFGNAAELIIAVMALKDGLYGVVKASLTGSIIGNILLVLGLSLLLGGVRFQRQRFNRVAASMAATLLALSAIGLLVPAMFHMAGGKASVLHIQDLSLAIAIVLFVAYILGLVFQLKTHQHLFAVGHGHAGGDGGDGPDGDDGGHDDVWSKKLAVGVLIVATALVAVMSEFLVGSVVHTAEAWGMTEVFVGVILVAIIGNAAEHSSAVLMAWKNKMDLSITIAVGSGIQIALFVAPVLVFLSYFLGPQPMDLEFTLFEVIAVWASVIVLAMVAGDGESHWMEGIMLLAVYIVLGIAFFFLPA